jgi:hypothetical protein
MRTKKLLKDLISITTHDLDKWHEAMGKFDKAKWKDHNKHCELYSKHQPKEEKEFYEESIRLHNEYEKELLSIPTNYTTSAEWGWSSKLPLNPTFNEEE